MTSTIIAPLALLTTIVRPSLEMIGRGGMPAEKLMMRTAAQEAQFRNIAQIGGPALGYWQMEPATHDDIWANYLAYKPGLAHLVRLLLPASKEPSAQLLMPFPSYACAMARLVYLRAPEAIPADLDGQAALYKLRYNTPGGAATVKEFIDHSVKLVDPIAAEAWPIAA